MALIDVVAKIKSDIKALADAIREKNNITGELTLEEMADEIAWIGGDGAEEDQTYILVDEDGVELPAFRTEEEVVLTATPNDIRIGTIAVTDDGIIEGTKEIPVYNTREGSRIVPAGSKFILPTETHYNYTKLQAIVCPYNTSPDNSVSAEKVVINNNTYNVLTTVPIAAVIKDENNLRIDLGITNETSRLYLIRYFMYKEIY